MNIIRFLHRKNESPFLYEYKTARQALQFMRNHGLSEVPVITQDGIYLGMVREGDFLWHLIDCGGFDAIRDHTLDKILRNGSAPALKITATDEELKRAALRSEYVSIVDDRGIFIGLVYREDIVQYFASKSQLQLV